MANGGSGTPLGDRRHHGGARQEAKKAEAPRNQESKLIMKKLILLGAVSALYPHFSAPKGLLEFTPKHPQPQAKAGIVQGEDMADTGESRSITALAESDPLIATVGSVVVLAAKASQNPVQILAALTNNLQIRVVDVLASGAEAAVNAAILAGATVLSATLTFDGGELNNAPMTNAVANGTGLSTAINGALAAAKPSFSMQSIINKIEDIVLLTEGVTDALIVVDQVNNNVKVYTGTPAQVSADRVLGAQAATSTLSEFVIDSTPASAASKLLGE